jgi:hypothetical protein
VAVRRQFLAALSSSAPAFALATTAALRLAAESKRLVGLRHFGHTHRMDGKRAQLIAKLARTDADIAMERRHHAGMTTQLDKARGLGWPRGTWQARELLDLSAERTVRLERERDELVIAIGSEPDQDPN